MSQFKDQVEPRRKESHTDNAGGCHVIDGLHILFCVVLCCKFDIGIVNSHGSHGGIGKDNKADGPQAKFR